MKNLLVLYNPYYNQEVIEDHIRILNEQPNANEAKVAFGKVDSKRKDYEHMFGKEVNALLDTVSTQNPLQLFLTDFSSMYVCYIEKVTKELEGVKAPKYYDDLNVDRWFVVSDIREITRNDFEFVRDNVITSFTTPDYGSYTYALYGNRYDYPLRIEQKNPINYFEEFSEGERHFMNVFKSDRHASAQHDLMHYVFGKELIYEMHPDTLESITTAEVEYMQYRDNKTHNFSSIVINYGKSFENEMYYFLRLLFEKLMAFDEKLKSIEYQVQSRNFTLEMYLCNKPNMGTNKFLLANSDIYGAYTELYSDRRKYASLLSLLKFNLKSAIYPIQQIRNEASHGGAISKKECDEVRNIILGIGESSILSEILKCKMVVCEES